MGVQLYDCGRGVHVVYVVCGLGFARAHGIDRWPVDAGVLGRVCGALVVGERLLCAALGLLVLGEVLKLKEAVEVARSQKSAAFSHGFLSVRGAADEEPPSRRPVASSRKPLEILAGRHRR